MSNMEEVYAEISVKKKPVKRPPTEIELLQEEVKGLRGLMEQMNDKIDNLNKDRQSTNK
jgi:predicted RNase H-like nuclease (RuvC/YqgF family)